MKPALRRIIAITAPVAVLAAASTASAGLVASHPYLTDNKVYPTVVGTNGSSYVDVAVRWAPHLLRRGQASHEMRVTLTGKGRKGAPIRFDAETVKRKGASRFEVVRLRIKKNQRGAYANARNVVVSSAHHWAAPSKSSTGILAARGSNLVAVSNANVKGTVGRAPYSRRTVRDCDVATLGPNSNAAGCDFSGANLAGATLTNANLSGATLDLANLAGADLSNANVTGASMVGTNISGANFGGTSQAAYAMPQAANPGQGVAAQCKKSGGGPMCDAIYSAKSTIGAVYYQFAGPNVTTWLQDAIRRGVDVFIIENSANTTPGSSAPWLCQTYSATDQTCAWSPKADPFYALEAQLKKVVGPGTGTVRVQFSSQNFNITHQKSILVDVLDSAGNALNPAQISAAGGSAIVSTGNMQAFPNFWGQRTISVNGKPKLLNPNYLSDPAAGCAAAPDGKCDPEWTPRDFVMKVTDPAILARVAGVYASDLACAPNTATNVQQYVGGQFIPGLIPDPAGSDPVSAQWPETWSNGSIFRKGDNLPPDLPQPGTFPLPGVYPNGYFAYGPTSYIPSNITGNVRARQVALIASAKKTLLVYNEEMSDFTKPYKGESINLKAPSIVNQIIAAGNRGVNVTIIMANQFWTDPTSGAKVPYRTPTTWAPQFDQIINKANYTQPGFIVPTILLIDGSASGPIYIHAKALIADGTDGWFGSINASSGSMNTNRELGLGITNRSDGSTPYIPAVYSPQMLATVTSAAASDAALGMSWGVATGPAPGPPPSFQGSAQFPCINMQANPDSGLPKRDTNDIKAPPQAPVTPPTP